MYTPVEQQLADDWTDARIIDLLVSRISSIFSPNAANQVRAPTTSHAKPTVDLACIVVRPSAGVVSTVPLKPTARVLLVDPSALLPIGLISPAFHLVPIGARIVPTGKVHVFRQATEPCFRKLLVIDVHTIP